MSAPPIARIDWWPARVPSPWMLKKISVTRIARSSTSPLAVLVLPSWCSEEGRGLSLTTFRPFPEPALGGLGGSGARSPQSEVERSSTGNHSDSPMPTFHKHGNSERRV